MGITVENFIKTFQVTLKAKDKTFEDFLNKHIIKNYIDITTKTYWCNFIVDITTHFRDGNEDVIKVDSVARYILFTMRLIDLYTDIDIDFKDGNYVHQYDTLNEVGAIDSIINAIPSSEYNEFTAILDMKIEDFKDNEYSVKAILYNIKKAISISESVFDEIISDAVHT